MSKGSSEVIHCNEGEKKQLALFPQELLSIKGEGCTAICVYEFPVFYYTATFMTVKNPIFLLTVLQLGCHKNHGGDRM